MTSRRADWDRWLAAALILVTAIEAVVVVGVVAGASGFIPTSLGRAVGWVGLNLALPLGLLDIVGGVIALASGRFRGWARVIAPSAIILGVLGILTALFLMLLSGRFGQVY